MRMEVDKSVKKESNKATPSKIDPSSDFPFTEEAPSLLFIVCYFTASLNIKDQAKEYGMALIVFTEGVIQ